MAALRPLRPFASRRSTSPASLLHYAGEEDQVAADFSSHARCTAVAYPQYGVASRRASTRHSIHSLLRDHS